VPSLRPGFLQQALVPWCSSVFIFLAFTFLEQPHRCRWLPAGSGAIDALAQRGFDEIGERPIIPGGGLPHFGEKIRIETDRDRCF